MTMFPDPGTLDFWFGVAVGVAVLVAVFVRSVRALLAEDLAENALSILDAAPPERWPLPRARARRRRG